MMEMAETAGIAQKQRHIQNIVRSRKKQALLLQCNNKMETSTYFSKPKVGQIQNMENYQSLKYFSLYGMH